MDNQKLFSKMTLARVSFSALTLIFLLGCQGTQGAHSSAFIPLVNPESDLGPDTLPGRILNPTANESDHQGYFIIADTGELIKGQDWFDFYTGPLPALSKTNPFYSLGYSGQSHHVTYFTVTGQTAKNVRDHYGMKSN